MARLTKKSIYAEYGIKYNKGKIYSPLLDMWIPALLINGNKKIGKGVWQYSITAGNRGIDAEQHCSGCHHCYSAEYVLFLKHGDVKYNPLLDPNYPAFVELVNSQAEDAA